MYWLNGKVGLGRNDVGTNRIDRYATTVCVCAILVVWKLRATRFFSGCLSWWAGQAACQNPSVNHFSVGNAESTKNLSPNQI
jgi:hypothetical protein